MPACSTAREVSAWPLVRPYERAPSLFRKSFAIAKAIGPISDAQKAADVMAPIAERADTENAWMMLLDVHGLLRRIDPFARGARDHVSVPIVEALRSAIAEGTRYCILVHNHPSGNAWPSQDDARLTWDVARACYAVSLVLLDHVIIGAGQFYSFRESATRWASRWPKDFPPA